MANFTADHRSIIRYYGGKTAKDYMSKMRRVIKCAKQENGATTLYDLFGGGAHLALNMTDEFDNIIYNEWSKCVYEFFNVLQDENKKYDLIDTLSHINPCRENFNIARALLDNEGKEGDEQRLERLGLTDVQMASVIFVITSLSFHANMQSFWEAEAKPDDLMKSIKELEQASEMLKSMELHNGDYWDIMKEHLEDKDAIIVLDPPYVKETRGVKGIDTYAKDDLDHEDLLRKCNQCKVPIIICGYKTELYDRELTQKGWKCISMGEYNVATVQTGDKKGKTTKKEEVIWTKNFDAPDSVE